MSTIGPEDSAIVESKTPRLSDLSSSAGMVEIASQPSLSVPPSVFDLLVRALADMRARGRRSTAAGVSAQMRLFDPSFNVAATEYRNFRTLLNAARARGLVDIADRGEGSDVEVALLQPADALDGERPATQLSRVKVDLWRAFLDWSPNASYCFERNSGKTSRCLDATQNATESADCIRIRSITKDEQLVWMRDFAALEPDSPSRVLLTGALAEPDPVHAFSRELRNSVSAAKRWKKHLRVNVLRQIQAWAETNSILLDDIQPTRAPTSGLTMESSTDLTSSHLTEEDLRKRALGIIATLPLNELLKLRLPLEYSIRI